MPPFTVYADLNCPFCYALHQQLVSLARMDVVDWRLVEHAPDISIFNNTPESQAELASEVFTVRSRAPDVQIALPPLRSDSRFATLCVIAAREICPQKAAQLLKNLYEALWIDGRDISATPVIYDCITAAGLPGELSIEESHETQLDSDQAVWEQQHNHLRVPVLLDEDGRKVLGLPTGEQIITFFGGGEQPKPVLSERHQCKSPPRQTIAVYGHQGVQGIWDVISAVRDDFNILLPASLTELKQQLLQPGDSPDLILLNAAHDLEQTLEDAEALTRLAAESYTPLALTGPALRDSDELQVYQAGAADYLIMDRSSDILRARIRTLLTLKRSHDLLERAARIDGLTQIYNRQEFERSLEVEWLRGRRSRQPLSLIMLDVDHFKQFNDHYGHLTGDGCLQHVATVITQCVNRPQDMVCRFGGEEFVVLLPETDHEGAYLLGERIRSAVEGLALEHKGSEASAFVTVSLGVATLSPSEGNPRTLVQIADEALYRAKAAGRNRVAV
jgi:diguanylate cyclase (GGDEF)-like protein